MVQRFATVLCVICLIHLSAMAAPAAIEYQGRPANSTSKSFITSAALPAIASPAGAAIKIDLTSGSLLWNGAPITPYKGESRIVVQASTTDTTRNANNLLSAYNYGKTIRPNGRDRSTTNRVTILLPWASYYFTDKPITMDAEFVDLVGLTQDDRLTPANRPNLNSFASPEHRWTLRQTANDVRIENLSIDGRGHAVMSPYASCYWPDANTTNTVIRNCDFGMDRGVRSMRQDVDYPGYYENCAAGGHSFGSGADASGTYVDCAAGSCSFGYGKSASGKFTRCISGDSCFGYNGFANGIFIDCEGSDYCFGSNGIANGTFYRCSAGNYSFGNQKYASGKFYQCKAKDYCFGEAGSASGQFVDCTGGNFAFAFSGEAGGTFTNCKAGHHAFGAGSAAKGGTASGMFVNCVAGPYSFGSTNHRANPPCTLGGTFIGCIAGHDSFGAVGAATAGATLYGCRMSGSWTGGVWAGQMYGCHWGSSIKCSPGGRILGSTVAGTIDLDKQAAGVTQSRAQSINNAENNVFGSTNAAAMNIANPNID